MFGLLGPDSAGTSTLMRTLAASQDADHGSAQLTDAAAGTDNNARIDSLGDKTAVRKVLGYLPQDFGVDPKVGAEDTLDPLARLKGLADRHERKAAVETLLRQTNLCDLRKRALGGFSGGLRQRFGSASASPRLRSASRGRSSSTSPPPASTRRSARACTTCSSRSATSTTRATPSPSIASA